MSQKFLSMQQIAAITRLSYATVRTYRSRGLLPKPDILVGAGRGATPGWSRETIQEWVKTLHRQAPAGATITVAQEIATHTWEQVRLAAQRHAARSEGERWKFLDRRLSELAAQYLGLGRTMQERLLWAKLADDIDIGPDMPEAPAVQTEQDAEYVLAAARKHAGYASARVTARAEQHGSDSDWYSADDYTVSDHVVRLVEHEADLRFLTMIKALGLEVELPS